MHQPCILDNELITSIQCLIHKIFNPSDPYINNPITGNFIHSLCGRVEGLLTINKGYVFSCLHFYSFKIFQSIFILNYTKLVNFLGLTVSKSVENLTVEVNFFIISLIALKFLKNKYPDIVYLE